MKRIFILCLIIILFYLVNSSVFAQSITPQPQTQYTNNFTVENKPYTVIRLLSNFIESFDSFMGGFIFYTPDPLASTIKLGDSSNIPGVGKYRDMFYQITIPVVAIIIASIAIVRIGSDNIQDLRAFATRFIVTLALFLIVPQALSYSIQFNNLLVKRITTTQKFTGFLQDYLSKSEEQINSGEDPEKYGIPSYDISLVGGVFKSLGKFIVQTFLFILTFLFLLGGFIYIGFQFVIRFATLLFLGVLYPIILPFALAERTQNIVTSFFKMWFTFLIQQPAFVLGFAIANDIFMNILNAKGPTVGMLFFYTGFLFFLGGVNMLVGRIFGDAWGMFATNMQAAIATRSVTSPVVSRLSDFKKGMFGNSLSYAAGAAAHRSRSGSQFPDQGLSKGKHFVPYQNGNTDDFTRRGKFTQEVTPFTEALRGRGFAVQSENEKQGVVTVSGSAYKYEDPKTRLTTIYPTRTEAHQDGVPEKQLEKIELNQARFIDLSSFNKKTPNPHNYNAMQESRKRGLEMNYAYINEFSPPHRIKQFLDVSKERNDTYDIQGVIAKRQGKEFSENIIRFYTYKRNEKRKNI